MSKKHHRQRQIGKREDIEFRPMTHEELMRCIAKQAKAEAIKKGLVKPKEPRTESFEWSLGDKSGVVVASTRSEARSLIKKELGISKNRRLPINIVIEQVK